MFWKAATSALDPSLTLRLICCSSAFLGNADACPDSVDMTVEVRDLRDGCVSTTARCYVGRSPCPACAPTSGSSIITSSPDTLIAIFRSRARGFPG